MKYVQYFFIAAIVSSFGFIVHVFSAEWLQAWIAQYMEGQSIIPSWDVRYIAMLTSLEYGISAIVLYWLIRDKIIKYGQFNAFIILSLLLTAIHGGVVEQISELIGVAMIRSPDSPSGRQHGQINT